jgi:hypothetical protein
MTEKNILSGRNGVIAACVIIVLSLAIRVGYGFAKTDYHVDEGITLALTNETWVPAAQLGLEGRWMEKQELEDIQFNDNLERLGYVDLKGLSAITAYDVHPPLYYWLFSAARLAVGVQNHMAANLLLNCACFLLSSFFLVVIMRRIFGDSPLVVFSLALFALSAAAVSETLFLRMYELLQMNCMGFLCCVILVMFPRTDRLAAVERKAALLGIIAFSFFGMLTQYYFLFFIAPLAIASFVVMRRRKKTFLIVVCGVALFAGLYLAESVFPSMIKHLTGSQRSGQSIDNLFSGNFANGLKWIFRYIVILARYVPAFPAFLVALVLALASRRANAARADESCADEVPNASSQSFIVILLAVSIFTFFLIAVSAPYQTLRYIVSFTPVYVMLFVSPIARLVPGKKGYVLLSVFLALGIFPGLLPGNIAHFHEDYRNANNPAYFMDDTPVIVATMYEGASWKPLLLFKNIPSHKRVYVATGAVNAQLESLFDMVAPESGSGEVYVFVDEWFAMQPEYEYIDHYAFYNVYRLSVE